MTGVPHSAEAQLKALRQFFLLRYHEEVRREYTVFQGSFPLTEGSRLDLVFLNGGTRVHFVYGRGRPREHLVVVRVLNISSTQDDEEERQLVRRALDVADPLAHFVVDAPFTDRFDRVEQEAVAAVRRHARLRPGD